MRKLLLLVALLVIGAAIVLVPLPVTAVTPGPSLPVAPRVELGTGGDTTVDGRYLLTTVELSAPTALGSVAALFDDTTDLTWRDQVVPPGMDPDEYIRLQQRLFDESGQLAAAVGLRQAGYDVSLGGRGARIVAIQPGLRTETDGTLREGDLITAVDGRPVTLAADLAALLAGRQAGDRVTVTRIRGDDTADVGVELRELAGADRIGLGVGVQTEDLRLVTPFPVQVDRGNIVGPSAGLAIALTVFDLADPEDLARGRTIAATGTVTATGEIGPIGGIEQKVASVAATDADLFVVPRSQLDEAQAADHGDLELVGAATVDEAIASLRS